MFWILLVRIHNRTPFYIYVLEALQLGPIGIDVDSMSKQYSSTVWLRPDILVQTISLVRLF